MSLVGDIIMELRERIPDAPAVMGAPTVGSLTGTTIPGGVFSGTISIAVTNNNVWGETQPSTTQTITLTGGQNAVQMQVSSPASDTATGINVYYGLGGTGVLTGVVRFPLQNNPQTIVLSTLGDAATPPTRPTAFLPDSDGNFIGGYTVYRLLNRALQEMVRISGGIIDVTGVQSTINTSMYRLDSPFYQFENAWFDGYPMDVVPRSFMYLRNSAAGFSGILSYEQDGPQSTIQVWPQSNRTGGSNQLAEATDDDAAFFQVFNGSGFLPIGLARIEDEVVVYSSTQNIIDNTQAPPFNNIWQFNGVLRGMGGTDAVAHPANAPVVELNIRLSGYRMTKTYEVGDSDEVIAVPQAWETPLVLHMLSQVRSMEQDEASSKELLSQFVQMADKIAKQSRMGKLKPRQIPIWGQNTSDARNINGIGFGWLIN